MKKGMDSNYDQFIAGYGKAESNKMFAIQYGLGDSYNYGIWLQGCTYDLSCDKTGDIGKANYIKNNYYHIVATYNKSDNLLKLFINGKLSESKSNSTISTSKSNIYIGGCSALKSKFFFNGYIDDLRFYNRVLTQPEINALYFPGSGQVVNNITEENTQNSDLIALKDLIKKDGLYYGVDDTTLYVSKNGNTYISLYESNKIFNALAATKNNVIGIQVEFDHSEVEYENGQLKAFHIAESDVMHIYDSLENELGYIQLSNASFESYSENDTPLDSILLKNNHILKLMVEIIFYTTIPAQKFYLYPREVFG
ncbi:MAG: hypothetical protein OMM_02332 [Candidatus Magnetoglobus multicellularis str. Araruama]|uniref:LamG-like jellyroll fold domain-containing protein n=1 Tax=Candidatus Magnetoglobus multicellularis str. Araruama TaxID=890399 RepID=A0A1V1P9W7_9BACT|nr:MAG: hypothetical protein OMM_02332 [Candidatus Magnetoglobus multicellularis str. Araruama]